MVLRIYLGGGGVGCLGKMEEEEGGREEGYI
jgi:hypothetical protein